MITKHNHLSALCAIAFLLFTYSSFAQEESLFDYLTSPDLLEITIESDFDSITLDKYMKDYQEATFQVKGKEEVWDIRLKTRGKFRRRLCQFPPLKLEFSKKDLKALGLASYDDLKLVTHCADMIEMQDYVLKEALIYELYQALTPASFRHQLVKVTYVNTGKRKYKIKKIGLLIEDEDNLASRVDGTLVDEFGINWEDLDMLSAELVASFQYLIGNTDWSIPMQRNIKFIQPADGGKMIMIPYDFDMTAIVNPVYGVPNPDLPIETLAQRYYLGTVTPSKQTIDFLKSKRESLKQICEDFTYLPKSSRKKIIKYIDTFFEELETDMAFEFQEDKE